MTKTTSWSSIIMQWDMFFPSNVSSVHDVGNRLAGGGAILKKRGSFRNGALFGGGFAIGRLVVVRSSLGKVLVVQIE